jgi:pyridoxine 5-phosphate synthase
MDVREIAPIVTTEFNIEGYPNSSFLDLVREVKPHQVTLVPDPPDAITSNAGWDTVKYESMLSDIISDLKSCGIRTSIFVDTELKHIEGAAKINTDRIELYTESYANYFLSDKESAIAPFIEAATLAYDSGLGINAGHDLSLVNLAFFATQVPHLDEVSIGHALISDALYLGLEETIQRYKNCLK